MNRVQLKTIAKQQLQGNIGMLFVCLLITWVLSNSVPGLASLIVAPPLTLGISMIFLGLTRNESPEINTLFSGFSYIGPAILLNIMIAIFTCLWSLLFVIPGSAPLCTGQTEDVSDTGGKRKTLFPGTAGVSAHPAKLEKEIRTADTPGRAARALCGSLPHARMYAVYGGSANHRFAEGTDKTG